MESKSFGESILEILRNYGSGVGGWATTQETKQAIIKLVEEIVPKEPFASAYKNCPAAWVDCAYKNFRQAILDRVRG